MHAFRWLLTVGFLGNVFEKRKVNVHRQIAFARCGEDVFFELVGLEGPESVLTSAVVAIVDEQSRSVRVLEDLRDGFHVPGRVSTHFDMVELCIAWMELEDDPRAERFFRAHQEA